MGVEDFSDALSLSRVVDVLTAGRLSLSSIVGRLMDTAPSGVAVVVLGLLWAVITAIPLFLFGFCLPKCFTFFSEGSRNTRTRRLLFPSLTGLAFVVAGLVTRAGSLDLTGPSGQAKLSLFFSTLRRVVDLPLMLVCMIVGMVHDRRRRRAQAPPLP